jgi:methylamine--corrinoid protein Co-methyltransferase
MIPFIEVIDRSLTGPYSLQEEFDLNVFVPKLREVTTKYKIKFDPDMPIPWDDDLADRVFQAAVEFYSQVGTYCIDTERIIKFSVSEILEGLNTAPFEPTFGEGRDYKKLLPRKPESEIPPWCFLGAAGAPVSSEEIFLKVMQGYASIPLVDSITTPTLTTINGRQIRASSPLEILACIRSSMLSREALSIAGRSGLPLMNSIATSVTDTAKIAGSQFGLRPSDGWLIGSIAEMKVNFQRLNEVAFVLSLGGRICAESGPLLGGYCGGAEGVAIANVAYHLHCILVLRGSCQVTFPLHYQTVCTSSRDLLWVVSVSSQAISRNSHFAFFTIPNTASGPVEEMCFYETAAIVTSLVVSGSSLEALGVYKNATVDLQTPQGPEFASEIAHAVPGMGRKEANDIVKHLLSIYENRINNPPIGKRYQESYDVKTGRPFDDTKRLYQRIKRETASFGFKFRY